MSKQPRKHTDAEKKRAVEKLTKLRMRQTGESSEKAHQHAARVARERDRVKGE